jgi:hypothetical protein
LSNGNALLLSTNWNGGAGAVTWINGNNGRLSNGAGGGVIGTANSLIGSAANEYISDAGVSELYSGNVLIQSPGWSNGGTAAFAGAVTWMNGSNGKLADGSNGGVIGSTNSLVGSTANDRVGGGASDIFYLSNGNYLVSSGFWSGNTGAVTFGNGSTGVTGVVSAANSLVGSTPGDGIGSQGIHELSNGNYLVLSGGWNGNSGAITFGSQTTGVSGVVSAANSLVGNPGDFIGGNNSLHNLSNGNYLVYSPYWASNTGFVTFGSGTSGVSGVISAANSLVGSAPGDYVGYYGITYLSNGNYVVNSPYWNGNTGAVTFGSGTSGVTGVVSAANSLVGSNPNDYVGNGGVQQLYSTGNYVVRSPDWNGGMGAMTWADGAAGISGVVSSVNSLVGSNANDYVGNYGIQQLSNGNFLVLSPDWNGGMGAVTFGRGSSGVTGTVGAGNSLVGSIAGDRVGDGGEGGYIISLPNGNFLVRSVYWNNSAGALTLGDGMNGVTGVVSSSNSIIGGVANSNMTFAGIDYVNNNFIVGFPNEPGGRVAVGSNVFNAVSGGGSLLFATTPATDITISPASIIATLNTGTAVTLQANNDITLNPFSDIVTTGGGAGGNLTLQAGRSIVLNSSITTDNGNLSLTANDPAAIPANRDPGAAMLSLGNGVTLNAGTGNVNMLLGTGSTAGDITTGTGVNIIGGQIDIQNTGGGNLKFGTATLVASGSVNLNSTLGTIEARGAGEYVNITGGSVTLNAGTFIDLGRAGGQGNVHATAGGVNITAGQSFGGCTVGCYSGSVISDTGSVAINAGTFIDTPQVQAANNVNLTAGTDIYVGDISANSIGLDASAAGAIFSYGGGVISAPTITLNAANGISALVGNNGVGLNVSNSTTGDIFLTSTAPVFTVGGGGAAINNTAAGEGYYIAAQNDMVLNSGTANNGQALFGAGNMLTVNGYSNASGQGVLMAANNVAFNGATNVSGALGVIAGNVDVNATVQGGTVNVVAGALNINGGDFQSTAGNFVGTVTGDVNVSGGGRIYGNPDVNLTVGGTIFINGANSRIEAFSPTSVRVLFPLLASGGYQINGATGTVWDALTNTGFYAGGLPAVLGGSLQITYGAAGLPPSVVAAINTTVAATNKSADADSDNKDKDKDKDANKEKTDKDEKSVGGNLKMQCN